jgi:NAD(P)H-flavin reductase
MAIMMSSVSIVDLIKSPDQAMTVVRYGAGAYGTLAWIAGSSILPLRRWSYRVFHLNHWVCTLVFLGFVARHVPSYARLPVYASIAIVAIDKGLCALTFLSNNITVRSSNKKSARYKPDYDRQVLAMGHPVKMMTPFIMNSTVVPKESATVIRISDVAFPWRPGQYVRLYIPKLGALEMHPFTPATCSDVSASPKLPPKDGDVEHHGLLPHNATATTNDLLFMIKAHSGWTKRLSDYHAEWLALPCPNASRPSSALTAYVDGPYGTAPVWESYENMILIASSTGVTFLLSILDYLEQLCFDAKSWPRTRRIHIIWANRHTEPQLEATVSDLLSRHTALLRESDTKVEVHFYTTCTEAVDEQVSMPDPFAHMRQSRPRYFARRRPLQIRNPNIPWTEEEEEEEEEAAWCEDDNVECTAMQHPSNADDMSRRSSCESTLIGDDPGHSDFDAMHRELDSSCWSRLSSLRLWRKEKITASANACQCAHLRHEQQKLRMKSPPEYVSRFYGERPDIASILTTSIPQLGIQSTMVVVCANERVIDTAKSVVSRMNMEYARGRRKAGVMIHTEGFD